MSANQTRGQRLQEARDTKDWTLGDVAEREYVNRFGKKRGVSRTTWGRWENDETWPPLEILDEVCQTLGVEMEDIDPTSVAKVLVLTGRYRPNATGQDDAPGGDASPRSRHLRQLVAA